MDNISWESAFERKDKLGSHNDGDSSFEEKVLYDIHPECFYTRHVSSAKYRLENAVFYANKFFIRVLCCAEGMRETSLYDGKNRLWIQDDVLRKFYPPTLTVNVAGGFWWQSYNHKGHGIDKANRWTNKKHPELADITCLTMAYKAVEGYLTCGLTCSRCTDCFNCSACENCTECTHCSWCSDCKGCARCYGLTGANGCTDHSARWGRS